MRALRNLAILGITGGALLVAIHPPTPPAEAGVFPAAPAQAPEQEARRPSAADWEKLHQMIKPQPGESRWMEIAWYPNVWEARQRAARLGKPLFIWAGSGGAPAAGC